MSILRFFGIASVPAILLFVPGAATLCAGERPVSFYHEVVPILKRSCNGCHHPGKLKGKLDLTTYEAFHKGGKSGSAFKPGEPAASLVIEQISGDEPVMPEDGDPLSKGEVALIARWIEEGATNDTPAGAGSFKLDTPPVYHALPVISTLAFAPDAKTLAVAGYHEVLLHSADGSNLLARLVGESPRIDSICYSPDGKLLGIAGSAPARFGEIQLWDRATNGLVRSFKVSPDSIYGLSFSPDATKVAVGCADKTVRILAVADGKELLKFDNHSDWVFGTTFTLDGQRILSGSRDRALKLIDVQSGQFIDDINKLIEPVFCMARHPKEDTVVYGGENGGVRIYKISDNQGRTIANNDANLVKELERFPGPVYNVAYSADGKRIAVGGASSEVRLYESDGKRVATLKGHEGAIFAIAFHPENGRVMTAGFDGKVRIYDGDKGELIHTFLPVPLETIKEAQQAAAN